MRIRSFLVVALMAMVSFRVPAAGPVTDPATGQVARYSWRRASMGSMWAARRAGK